MNTSTRIKWQWFCVFLSVMFSVFCLPAYAVVVLSAPPYSSAEDALQTFKPLAKYLEEILGEPVIYKHPVDWVDYSHNMRQGNYDIVFDEPHFSSWRIKHIQHTPVVRLPGKLGFVILAKKDNPNLTTLRDLVGVNICALASPAIGTMSVYKLFANPVFMPQIREIPGDFGDVYKALKEGQCEAAVLRDTTYNHLVPADKRDVKIVARSELLPERTLTIGPRLLAKKKLITNKLMSAKGTRAAANLMTKFGKRSDAFVPVNNSDYRGLETMLTDVVWGW